MDAPWVTWAGLLGFVAGLLHGTSMAMRKQSGEGSKHYWKQGRWWIGFLLDWAGGFIFFCCSPHVASAILLAVCVGAQLSVSVLLGLLYFGENASTLGKVGLSFTLCGSVALAFRGQSETVILSPAEFWAQWVSTDFLVVNGAWIVVIAALFLLKESALAYLSIAAYADGVQFLTTRCLASVLVTSAPFSGIVWIAILAKIVLIVVYLHCQQLALMKDLHVVGSLYPVIASLMAMTIAATVFDDNIIWSTPLCFASSATIIGVILQTIPPKSDSHALKEEFGEPLVTEKQESLLGHKSK